MQNLKIHLPISNHNVFGYDNEFIHMEHEWDTDRVIKIAWTDLSLNIHDLIDLYRALYKIDKTILNKVYEAHINSIKKEGFNYEQASLISYEAYERGHSGGQDEVLSYVADYITFANELIKRGKL